jgi:RNA recognition motif-containing protein
MKVNGVPIHISWREVNYRPDPDAMLVITSIPPTVDEAELHDALQEYGTVNSVRITRRPSGESTGIAYVQFGAAESARAACEALQGAAINGQEIKVDYFRSAGDRSETSKKLPARYIAVEAVDGGRLPPSAVLLTLFERCGEVLEIYEIQGYAIVEFARPESVGAVMAAAISGDNIRVLTGLRLSVQQLLFARVERRKVYVNDLTVAGLNGISDLFASVGRVVRVQNVNHVKGHCAIVQFESAEARARALDVDGQTPNGQVMPVTVLPFLDKRIDHATAGLLQINEIEPCTRSELRARYAVFGAVAAAAIAPTAAFVVGFVLFEKLEDAVRARNEQLNALVFPIENVQLHDIATSFADKGRARHLAIYGVDGRAALVAAAGPTVSFGWFTTIGGERVALATFRDRGDLLQATEKLFKAGIRFDVLSSYLLQRAGQWLSQTPMALGQGRMLFVTNVPRGVGNKELREAFEGFGRVEAAAVSVDTRTGIPIGKGVVLFKDQESALAAKTEPPRPGGIRESVRVTDFKGKLERATVEPEPVKKDDVVQRTIPKVRSCLKNMLIAKAEIPRERINTLVTSVQELCLNDVYQLVQSPDKLDKWIETGAL